MCSAVSPPTPFTALTGEQMAHLNTPLTRNELAAFESIAGPTSSTPPHQEMRRLFEKVIHCIENQIYRTKILQARLAESEKLEAL